MEVTMMTNKKFLQKLEDIKYEMVKKQCEVDDLIRKVKERNEDELWVKLDLLLEEYGDATQ